jgi:hypothetical protein
MVNRYPHLLLGTQKDETRYQDQFFMNAELQNTDFRRQFEKLVFKALQKISCYLFPLLHELTFLVLFNNILLFQKIVKISNQIHMTVAFADDFRAEKHRERLSYGPFNCLPLVVVDVRCERGC